MKYTSKLILNGTEYEFGAENGWQPGANTLAYYTLDNSGTNLSTLTSKFADVTLNTATYSDTKAHGNRSKSLYCSGSTYAYIPASALHEFGTDDFTISVWVYSETNSGTYTGFISNSAGAYPHSGDAYRIADRFNSNNYYNFCWAAGPDNNQYRLNMSTGTSIKDGWHNCVVVRDSGTFFVYLDGELKTSSSSYSERVVGVNANIALGYNIIDSAYSKVYMNDLIFENKGWSAQDVADYYTLTA